MPSTNFIGGPSGILGSGLYVGTGGTISKTQGELSKRRLAIDSLERKGEPKVDEIVHSFSEGLA
jgi:hypothetical protein